MWLSYMACPLIVLLMICRLPNLSRHCNGLAAFARVSPGSDTTMGTNWRCRMNSEQRTAEKKRKKKSENRKLKSAGEEHGLVKVWLGKAGLA